MFLKFTADGPKLLACSAVCHEKMETANRRALRGLCK
jgi:hypothetical protein